MAKATKNESPAEVTVGGEKGAKSRGRTKVREGMVVSNKMTKTVVVAVERRVKHPTYGKVVRRTKRLYAHDEKAECGIGDRVEVVETRPLSKLKRWKIVRIVERAELSPGEMVVA